MTEYITKERAQDLIVTAAQGNGSRLACLLSKLEDEPAADVAPVVHGHWKFYGEDGHGYGLLKCTRCGNVTGEKYAEAYCPHCGARML